MRLLQYTIITESIVVYVHQSYCCEFTAILMLARVVTQYHVGNMPI